MNESAEPSEQIDSPRDLAVSAFERAAGEPEIGLVREFVLFLKEHRAWWLVPILLSFALLGLLAFFAGSPLAPFIYPLF